MPNLVEDAEYWPLLVVLLDRYRLAAKGTGEGRTRLSAANQRADTGKGSGKLIQRGGFGPVHRQPQLFQAFDQFGGVTAGPRQYQVRLHSQYGLEVETVVGTDAWHLLSGFRKIAVLNRTDQQVAAAQVEEDLGQVRSQADYPPGWARQGHGIAGIINHRNLAGPGKTDPGEKQDDD